jgi:hypothetical protein
MSGDESPKQRAIEELAKFLHWKQHVLDPGAGETDGIPRWDTLSEDEREFYRSSVECLLDNRELVIAALSQR